jgi:hypothetical protein
LRQYGPQTGADNAVYADVRIRSSPVFSRLTPVLRAPETGERLGDRTMRSMMRLALASGAVLAALAATATAASGQTPPPRLTLFGTEGFSGAPVTLTRDVSNLQSVAAADGFDGTANDYARSLRAQGRWLVCMDAGFLTGCREVSGDVADLGEDGGSISSARYLGPARVAAATGGQTSAPAAGPLGAVYETIDWGDLTVTEWGESSFAASYVHDGGRITGRRSGNRIDGVWVQPRSAQRCDTPRNGSFFHGRMTFAFNAALDAFEGLWGYCDAEPSETWNGTLTTRGAQPVAASASTRSAGTSQPPQRPSTRPPASRTPSATPLGPQADANEDYVYATRYDGDVFKPALQMSAFGPQMTGRYTITNPESDFERHYRGGFGAITAGRLEGSFSGNTFTGMWYEAENEQGLARVQRTCDRAQGGTRVWGPIQLRFTPDRRSFVGTISTCDKVIAELYRFQIDNWRGTLTGRAPAATAATPGGATASAAGGPAAGRTSANRTAGTGGQSTAPRHPAAPREETVADRIAREAAEAAEQRAREETREGVNRAIDGILRRRP